MVETTTPFGEENVRISFYNKIETIDVVLTFIGSCLSVVGAILLFLAHYIRWKKGMCINDARKYLLCLTIADLGNAIGYLWGVSRYVRSTDDMEGNITACRIEEEQGCIGQSFVTTSFTMSSFFWTALIALHLYSTYGIANKQKSSYRRWIVYSIAGWGIPLSITIAAFNLDKLGSDLSVGSGAWCWISACLSNEQRTIWMTISGKGWEILMYLLCCGCYMFLKHKKLKARRKLKKECNFELQQRYPNVQKAKEPPVKEDVRFILLWLVEVALRIWGTVRYIAAAVRRHTDNELPDYNSADTWFLHFQSFGDSAQAFCSCVLFCILERDTRKLLINTLFCNRKISDERVAIIQELEDRV